MAKNSLTSLLAQKAALDKQIADMQRAQRGDAIAKVKAMMAEYGLTPEDLAGSSRAASPAPARKAAAADAAAPARRAPRKSAVAGKKVAPKYRDPATGATWSGRGLKPKWLSAALASGRQISDFAL